MKELRSIIANYLNGVRDQIKNDKPIHIKQAVDIITHFIDTPDLIEKFYQLTAMSHNNGDKDYLIRHLINVMICSIKIGTHLGYPREELIELGLAALLYDVGLFKIPESITGKIGKLTNTELGIIKKHTSIGRDILSPFRDEHPIPCRAAYEHHERENGNGYPEGLKGNEICKCAKIIFPKSRLSSTAQQFLSSRQSLTSNIQKHSAFYQKNIHTAQHHSFSTHLSSSSSHQQFVSLSP